MAEVRETIAHLFSLGRFQDIQVEAFDADGGVRLRFNLEPIHPVQKVEFRATSSCPRARCVTRSPSASGRHRRLVERLTSRSCCRRSTTSAATSMRRSVRRSVSYTIPTGRS